MYAQIRIPKEKTTADSPKRGRGGSAFQLLDNRPEASAHRKPAFHNVVQRQISGVTAELPAPILEVATSYNELGAETPISTRINKLSLVEHAVYAWLTENRKPDMTEVAGSARVRHLMDTTKAERHRIVEHSVNVSRDHLGENGIPVAGLDELGPHDRDEVRRLWRGLIEGTGKIAITETNPDTGEKHDGFGMKVLVEFSRLLEGKFGRSMVRDIDASTHQVVIEPFRVGERAKSFAAGPLTHDADKLQKLADPPPADELDHYREIDITALGESQRLHLFNDLKPTEAGQLGVKIVDGEVSTYYRFGLGTAVRVTMPSDLADGSQQKESRLADAEGNELATPVFITLGHELGHGIHMQRGTLTRETGIPNFFNDEVDKEAYRSNPEEYVNIEGNENALRHEHGLGKRKGHYSIPYLQMQQVNVPVNALLAWIDSLGPVKNLPVYREIDSMLMDIATRAHTQWTDPEALRAVRRDFENLPGPMQKLQSDYAHGGFPISIDAEHKRLTLGLYGIKFSFATVFDIPRIALALDAEFAYEKIQAGVAAGRNTVSQYLTTLPAARRAYAATHYDKTVASIAVGVDEHAVQNDKQQFAKLQQLLNDFERVAWLFPG